MTMVGQKRRHEESLNAIKARFVELFVMKAPKQNPDDLKHCDNFERDHCVLGIYERVLLTVEKYNKNDFHSNVMATYFTSALVKFADLYAVVMGDNPTRRIKLLMDKLDLKDYKFKGRLPEEDNRQDDVDQSTSQPSQCSDSGIVDPAFGCRDFYQ